MNQYEPETAATHVGYNGASDYDRRSSRRRSQVRHGRIYEETESTIRAVTPESASSTNMDITALPSPTSFLPQSNTRFQVHDPAASVSNTDEESTIDSRRRKVKKKSKQHDNTQSDTSPNSFFEKTRKRLNSITTASSNAPRHDDPTISIGFPSVVQASVFPDLQDVRQNLPRRTFSSDNTTAAPTSSIRSPLVIESDADKILKLMKTLNGRMHGILFYRPIGTTAWYSGYCAINVAPGSLVCQMKGDVTKTETLIPDLRGCSVKTHYDAPEQNAHISVVLPISGLGYQLRPPVPETFESWLAAFLCWQPLKPKGIHNKMTKPQSISVTERPSMGNRRMSDIASPRSTAVVKSSQMLLWDSALPTGSHRHHSKKLKFGAFEPQPPWRRVNCTLHENGTLRLLAEENAMTLRSLNLGTLVRCAIQRLDESVLRAPYCIAIHPQYTTTPTRPTSNQPLVLALSTQVAFEAWFVLLQAMTVPELYGPEVNVQRHSRPTSLGDPSSMHRNMFRIERSLQIKIIEARFPEYAHSREQQYAQSSRLAPKIIDRRGMDVYADVVLGRDLRARTINKQFANSIFWADDFVIEDIPPVLSRVSVILKTGNPDEKEWTMTTREDYELHDGDNIPNLESVEVASHDPVFGKVDISLNDLEQDKFVEKWWPLLDNAGVDIGQALIRLSLDENVVLMEGEYAKLSAILHNFDNSLTSQLAQVLGTELKALSDVLLDIFQVSNKVEEWINNLIEEEIDGIYREQPPMRMRFSGRIHSNDSYETAEQRELLVRDLSRSATMEANLLFRGNSLVTKALDAHMRRLGKDYLEKTLGEKLRSIAFNDRNCEVDPNKVKSSDQLDKNWSTLIGLTSSIWQAIATSATKCPPGMRNVLKHIRSCAEDRYGNFIRTVKYTSVSGFLFLRFFCPAILNPKLFGLLEDHPPERPRRTFTLIAKALMTLANMTRFGQKEPWMEPMNKFLTAATPEFKNFIEEICSWSSSQEVPHEPQYQAAAQVKTRLPTLSKEGLPSLPFLLDAPRSMAILVETWLERALPEPEETTETGPDNVVQQFHQICLDVQQKTKDSMANAETAQEPNSAVDERKWQKMLSEQPKTRFAPNPYEELAGDNEITALPQPTEQRRYTSRHLHLGGYSEKSPPIQEQEFEHTESSHGMTSPISSPRTYTQNQHEELQPRGGQRSDGPTRSRLLEITNHKRHRDPVLDSTNRI